MPSKKPKTDAHHDLQKKASQLILTPAGVAANAINALYDQVRIDHEQDITGLDMKVLYEQLQEQNQQLKTGNLGRIENMLLSQAHVLQSMFALYLQRMANSNYLNQTESYAAIALKAQNQCRQTLATLGELKNPKRATFIKQQNNAVNQQINQAEATTEISKNLATSTNELLEQHYGKRLDSGTAQAPSSFDQDLATVATIDRT